jgi:plasmid stability protein
MPHVQIRNMPADMHRTFKVRAAAAGMSLSEYLLRELRPSADLPTLEEWVDEVRSRPKVTLEKSAAEIIREEREKRDEELLRRLGRVGGD